MLGHAPHPQRMVTHVKKGRPPMIRQRLVLHVVATGTLLMGLAPTAPIGRLIAARLPT